MVLTTRFEFLWLFSRILGCLWKYPFGERVSDLERPGSALTRSHTWTWPRNDI